MIQQSIVSFLLVAVSHPRADPQKTEAPFAMGLIGGTLARASIGSHAGGLCAAGRKGSQGAQPAGRLFPRHVRQQTRPEWQPTSVSDFL